MISKIIKNSAVSAKIKSKLKNRLTRKDYRRMVDCRSVPGIAEYLKENAGYAAIFNKVNVSELHRGVLEEMLRLNTKNETCSLMPYLGMNMKSFLKIYDIQDEVQGIKNCARRLYSKSEAEFDGRYIKRYLELNSTVDFVRLFEAGNFDEFAAILSETSYKDMFSSLKSNVELQNLFNIETILDLYYVRTLLKHIKKYTSGKENKSLKILIGTEIDLINISAIIRAKRYYKMRAEEIYSILFMGGYRLKREDITRLVNAESGDEVISALQNTAYKEIFNTDEAFFEISVNTYIFNMHRRILKNEPYSDIAAVSYMYLKRNELKNIITIVEGVRYGLSPEKIRKYIVI